MCLPGGDDEAYGGVKKSNGEYCAFGKDLPGSAPEGMEPIPLIDEEGHLGNSPSRGGMGDNLFGMERST